MAVNPFPSLHVYIYGREAGPLTARFDDVADRLTQLPRLQFEPDGSLLLSGQGWQLGGMLYDRAGIVQYVDLQGSCPLARWRDVIGCIVESAMQSTVLRLPDRSLHDLQTFERITWAAGEGAKQQQPLVD
jgi:hypothetical protein